ncbi:MAG: hypothetical protein FWK04_02510 [Nostoc sp. GBBB01]|nr:hypothetical protein [Nostoc sp. GBBB01]
MRLKFITRKVTAIAVAFGSLAIVTQPSMAQDIPGYYYCGTSGKDPATIYQSGTSELVFILWVSDYFSEVATRQERCQKVSQKFEQNRQDNNLNFIVPGTSGSDAAQAGLPVLCASRVATSKAITCPDRQILYTLKSEKDAQPAIEQIAGQTEERTTRPLLETGGLTKIREGFRIINVFKMNQNLRPKEPSTYDGGCIRGRNGLCRRSN